jgi:hypothetical protein
MKDEQTPLDKLEAHRKFIGMKQSELCKSLKIHASTYFRWRMDGTTPYNESRVADALRKFAKQHNLARP